MTIDEAIKLLEDDIHLDADLFHPKLYEAEKLGIEAMKRLKDIRQTIYSDFNSLLPGETKEGG